MRCARERAGTLVVALTMPYIVGGRFRTSSCSAIVQSRDAFQALLSLSALCAVLQRCRAWSGGRPAGMISIREAPSLAPLDFYIDLFHSKQACFISGDSL